MNIRPKDIDLLCKAVQFMLTSADHAFADYYPEDRPKMISAAQGLPVKLRFHATDMDQLELVVFVEACDYASQFDSSLSKSQRIILEDYADFVMSLLLSHYPDKLL